MKLSGMEKFYQFQQYLQIIFIINNKPYMTTVWMCEREREPSQYFGLSNVQPKLLEWLLSVTIEQKVIFGRTILCGLQLNLFRQIHVQIDMFFIVLIIIKFIYWVLFKFQVSFANFILIRGMKCFFLLSFHILMNFQILANNHKQTFYTYFYVHSFFF